MLALEEFMVSWFGKKSRQTVCTAVTALMFALAAGIGHANERVGDFALLDHDGYFHHMAWYDNNKAIAFLVQGNGVAETERSLAAFAELKAKYEDQGIVFFMINPLGEERAAVREQVAAWGVDIPVLIDDVHAISENLGITHFGQAVVYNPRSFRVMYSGPADASLADALASVVADESISNASVAVNGREVTFPERDPSSIRYSEHVAPVIAQNCADCHRDGGIAPFALDSHAMVQGWSPMIREVLMTKRMPPGQLDPHIGEFENHMTLAFEDERNILDWIAAGAQRDENVPDPLAQIEWPESVWILGEPDLIIEVPEQHIPATGVLDYINVVVPVDIDRERWVRASQYVPGDHRVLHHTLNFLIPPGSDPRRGGFTATPDPNAAYIQAYVPGASPHIEPPNTGGVLKPGSMLALQLHYTTFGQEAVDNSKIGIWFYDDDNIPTERMTGECACIFTPEWTNIPPYDPEFVQTKHITIPDDAYLHGFLPHMHFRGKYMKFDAHLPDGTVQPLINIAQYNYNWQMTYTPKEPIFVPAGTRVVATAAFDNSEQNPANPDPSRSVPWGLQSWDEMMFGQVYYKFVDQSRYQENQQEGQLVGSAN
jgi:hypothetical protein